MQIHNIRSINDATIDLRDLSLLAGANNAGKSNVIDAIRLFYAELKWDEKRDLALLPGVDSDSWVEIEFKPTEAELSQLKDDYRSANGTFRVRNYFKAEPGPDGKIHSGYYAYENGKISNNLFYGAKNVGSAKIGKIVYIPAVSKVDDHTKLSGPSALRDLVATVMTKVVAESPAYEALQKAFSSFEAEIKAQETDEGQSLQALELEISQELSGWDSSFNFGIQSIQPDDIVKSLIRPMLTDDTHGGEVDQLRFGAGFQRHLVYSLIKLAAKYSNGNKSFSTKKEFSPELTWLLFEEPEAFLHPIQEEVLYESLLGLVSDEATQVLLTTHSSRFVSRSMNDLTRLIRVRRESGVTKIFQIDKAELDALFDASLLADAEIDPDLLAVKNRPVNEVMSALKVELWMQPQRAAAFFARRVVLVEGPTELALYSYLSEKGYISPVEPGVMFLDSMGKYNIHRLMSLLGKFGVEHSVLYDGDNGGSHDKEVTKTISDAKNPFTRHVIRLGVDIETELGISPLPRNKSNRKPQYLLYHFEAKLIDRNKLNSVVEILMELCTK